MYVGFYWNIQDCRWFVLPGIFCLQFTICLVINHIFWQKVTKPHDYTTFDLANVNICIKLYISRINRTLRLIKHIKAMMSAKKIIKKSKFVLGFHSHKQYHSTVSLFGRLKYQLQLLPQQHNRHSIDIFPLLEEHSIPRHLFEFIIH